PWVNGPISSVFVSLVSCGHCHASLARLQREQACSRYAENHEREQRLLIFRISIVPSPDGFAVHPFARSGAGPHADPPSGSTLLLKGVGRAMNWDDVRIFLTVARAGQTLGAARPLAPHRAAVSR